MSSMQNAVKTVLKKAVEAVPDAWVPGGTPDPLSTRKHGLVGTQVARLDGPLKVTGSAPFAAEFDVDGMVFASVLFSTIAAGRIASLDVSRAVAAPGVVFVMTYKNAPKLKPMPLFNSKPKAAGPTDLPVMQDDCIHWNGEAVAVVLAETQEQADFAKSLIEVTYEASAAITSFAEAKKHAHQPDSIQGEAPEVVVGDAEAALSAAAHRVDHIYTTPRHNHNAIELHAVTLFWKDDELFLHDASQAVAQTAWTLGEVFGMDEAKIHVTSPFVGGGFGGKTLWHHHVLAAAAAKQARRPVRMVLSREGVYRTVGGRTTTEQRVALGAAADGSLDALIHTGVVAMTAHNNTPEQFSFPARHVYASRNIKLAQEVAEMNMVANTFMRAPGESVGTFALESAMDELAEQLGLDPIELRRRNEPEKDPTTGTPFSSRNLLKAYQDGAAHFGWEKRVSTPRARREGDWWVGMGCATATYPYYRMPGGGARIRLTADGVARIDFAAHEMGMGTSTTHAIVMAERMGLAMECIDINYGSSDHAGTFLAGGSSQTASIGAALIATHDALVKKLLDLVTKDSPLYGLKHDEVVSQNAGLAKADDSRRHESYVSLLARAGKDEVVAEADAPPPLEIMHWSMHSFGAVFAEVKVNCITCETRVSRILGSYDCGRILNARTAASQFRGGIIMGLGLALMEETEFDERNGRIANPSLAEYHLPVHMDVPAIEVMWTDIPDPHTPAGARGIGEIGITGTAAAVANAIYNACGKRVRHLPITLDKLMD